MTCSPKETRSRAPKPPREVFTIQRKGTPGSPYRFLAIGDDGALCWAMPGVNFNVYATKRSAELFRQFRLGPHTSGAEVVRHAVN